MYRLSYNSVPQVYMQFCRPASALCLTSLACFWHFLWNSKHVALRPQKSHGSLRIGRSGEGVWRWGKRNNYYIIFIRIATMSPSEWLLHEDGQRWEQFRCYINYDGLSHKAVSTDHNFWRERRAEVDSNRDSSVSQPNALTLGQTGPLIFDSVCSGISWETMDM